MTVLLKKLTSENKPWALLRISRRHYETTRPWKKSNMTRERFEVMISEMMTDELYQHIKDHADAEDLVASLFGPQAIE